MTYGDVPMLTTETLAALRDEHHRQRVNVGTGIDLLVVLQGIRRADHLERELLQRVLGIFGTGKATAKIAEELAPAFNQLTFDHAIVGGQVLRVGWVTEEYRHRRWLQAHGIDKSGGAAGAGTRRRSPLRRSLGDEAGGRCRRLIAMFRAA